LTERLLVADPVRARHRLGKFLLRHDRIWRDGDAWTAKHEQWLTGQRFDDAALRATYGHYGRCWWPATRTWRRG
jgi:hypothetical protein